MVAGADFFPIRTNELFVKRLFYERYLIFAS